MKKLIVIGAAAALVLASCSDRKNETSTESMESLLSQRLEAAKTFEDTVIAVDGTFMGGFFNYNLHTDPELSANLSMKEVERGIRQVMSADTTNMSYIYGLQVGMTIMSTFREISADMPIDRTKLMETIFGTLRLDSIDRDQLLEIRGQFERMDSEIKARKEAELNRTAYDSREAVENRMLADAVCAKLKSEPDYQPIGNSGIYRKVIKEGNGTNFKSDDRLRASYSVSRLSGEPLETVNDKAMFAGHAANPMLTAVLVHMSPGEESEFYIPYELVYGPQGNPEMKIGPCESVMIHVSVE